jgi:septum formation protein
MSEDFVYLASASPRRRELLAQIGVPFQLLAVDVDETTAPGEGPEAYVRRVSAAKAASGWAAPLRHLPAPVLAADTAVVLGGRILQKPADAEDGMRMLLDLSGRTHEVLTAIALATARGLQSRLSRSEVTFRAISRSEARAYWETGEPRDKAGGYAIQGRAAVFVADLKGSHSGVMGLPLFETAALLESEGVPRWRSPEAGGPHAH